jgi:hypothetical protein
LPFSIDWKNKKIMLGKKRMAANSQILLNWQAFRIN